MSNGKMPGRKVVMTDGRKMDKKTAKRLISYITKGHKKQLFYLHLVQKKFFEQL